MGAIGASGPGKVAAALLLIYAVAVGAAQLGYLFDTSYLHEEFRLLFRYHHVSNPALFAGDYLAGYVGAFPQPYLYEWVTVLWLSAGGDLSVLHRLLPLACWLALLAGMLVAARRLGDQLTVLGALTLVIVQPVYLYQITSALPHAFAFPLLVWALVAALSASTLGLAASTVLAGLLYPAMAPLLGLLLAWHLLIARNWWQQPGTEQVRTVLLLALTAAVALWLVVDSLGGTTLYGAAIEPVQQVDRYPENGPEGKYFYAVFHPLKYVLARAVSQFRMPIGPYSILAVAVYAAVVVYGCFTLPRCRRVRTALFGFLLSGMVLCLVVFALKPFQAYRFVLYPIYTLAPLLFVVGVQHLCSRVYGQRPWSPAIAATAIMLCALGFDGTDARKIGYQWRLDSELRQFVDFAAGQPPATLFAAWPDGKGHSEMVPYLARRPTLVLEKAHYPNYVNHIIEMRARTNALIDAYLATGPAPLQALHCRWGVDFLIVEKAHFDGTGELPRYFAPFNTRIERIWRAHRRADFLLSEPGPAGIALETESLLVLRLPLPSAETPPGCAAEQGGVEAAGAGL